MHHRVLTGLDYQKAKAVIIALEAFRGRDPEEYYHLVEPLSNFVCNTGIYDLPEVNRLVKAILAHRPETTTMEIEPSATSQFLADQIKPWVEDIRQRLFHSKSAPFDCIEDAQIWRNEAEKKLDEWHKGADEWSKRAHERLSRIKELEDQRFSMLWPKINIEEVSRIQGILQELSSQEEWRQLGEPPEEDEQMEVFFSLIEDILEIVKVTGFTQQSVVMYILADASPVLPPFTFGIVRRTHSLPDGTSLLNRFARATIRGDLTFGDLRSLYRSIRRELGIKRSKRPTIKHLQLYEMVRRKGAIPSGKGTVAFWESVKKEWNDLHRQDKYKTWKGVKLAYERIIAQLERRITTKGGTT